MRVMLLFDDVWELDEVGDDLVGVMGWLMIGLICCVVGVDVGVIVGLVGCCVGVCVLSVCVFLCWCMVDVSCMLLRFSMISVILVMVDSIWLVVVSVGLLLVLIDYMIVSMLVN